MKFLNITSNSYLPKVIFLLGKEANKLPFMIVLFLVLGILDMLGLSIIIPFISVIIEPTLIMESDLYIKYAYLGLPSDPNYLIVYLGVTLLLLFTFKSLTALFVNKAILDFCFNQGYLLRKKLITYYLSIKYEIYIEKNTSEYIYSIENLATQYSQNILQSLLRITSEIIIVIMILCFFAYQDLTSLIILIVIVFTAVGIYEALFRRRTSEYGVLTNHAQAGLIKGIHEGLNGLKEIRILGVAIFFQKLVSSCAKTYSTYSAKYFLIGQTPKYFIELLLLLFITTIIFVNIYLGNTVSQMVPLIGMFGFGALRIAPSLNQILSSISHLRFAKDALNKLYEDLQNYSDNSLESFKVNIIDGNKPFESLILKDVCFSFAGSNLKVLDSININIQKGDFIGLIGPSGSGKTTLADIILGLFEINSGSIMFNDMDIYKNLASWRDRVAYLPQNIFLTDDTIRRNIAVGINDDEINNSKLNLSIESAQLTDLISSLPNGINTQIGEMGIKLSGGQRQRIAIARAFYFDRDFLILDESTSSLDAKVEKDIVAEINKLKGDKTLLVIAHRLSTLEKCDKIYELTNGVITKEHSFGSLGKKD